MYFPLILFFGSLAGISFMIGRKLLMLQNGQVFSRDETFLKAPHLEELKQKTVKNIKKYGYMGLVTTIRFYIRSTNFIKNKYEEMKIKIKNTRFQKSNKKTEDKQEISKFLKIISEYKRKIREIKHKIKEEDRNL